jgi:hypothetical protein
MTGFAFLPFTRAGISEPVQGWDVNLDERFLSSFGRTSRIVLRVLGLGPMDIPLARSMDHGTNVWELVRFISVYELLPPYDGESVLRHYRARATMDFWERYPATHDVETSWQIEWGN